MKFSVICPVYNGEKYLTEAIESVFLQTYKNWELIIIDDCSTDNSNLIANKFARQDSKIIVIRNDKNKGQFFSRIEGIKKSSGEAIVFLDSDDKLKPKCLEILLKRFHENELLDCITYNCEQLLQDNLSLQDIDKISEDSLIGSNIVFYKSVFIDKTIPTVWRYCFKRESIMKTVDLNLTCETRLGEDMFFLTVAVLNITNSLLISDSLYIYRLNRNSICHTLDSNRAFDRFKSIEASYFYVYSKLPGLLKLLTYQVINTVSWSAVKYLELGSGEDSKKNFKLRCRQIKRSLIWKLLIRKHKFESKYPNLVLTCFKLNCLPLVRWIVKKYINRKYE